LRGQNAHGQTWGFVSQSEGIVPRLYCVRQLAVLQKYLRFLNPFHAGDAWHMPCTTSHRTLPHTCLSISRVWASRRPARVCSWTGCDACCLEEKRQPQGCRGRRVIPLHACNLCGTTGQAVHDNMFLHMHMPCCLIGSRYTQSRVILMESTGHVCRSTILAADVGQRDALPGRIVYHKLIPNNC
jgi:hypothetical protein